MEPREFNERLEDLVEEARDSGLHEEHILNALESQQNQSEASGRSL